MPGPGSRRQPVRKKQYEAASENQERLNSMVQADNAIKERVKALRLELNALRQKEITEELLEIVNTYRSMVRK